MPTREELRAELEAEIEQDPSIMEGFEDIEEALDALEFVDDLIESNSEE